MDESQQLRRFNEAGMRAVSLRLLEIAGGSRTDVEGLLCDDSLTSVVEPGVVLERRSFKNRFAAAEYFAGLFADLPRDEVEADSGLWTWLALLWIDDLAPVKKGTRNLGQINRWILASDDWKRYYRHLFAGPYYLFKAHEDDPRRAMSVLCGSISKPGELVEQVASRFDLVRSPGLMGAVTALYYDPERKEIKSGAGGKNRPGTSRRLGPVLMQLDRTWDIYSLSAREVLELLPSEFEKFMPTKAQAAQLKYL